MNWIHNAFLADAGLGGLLTIVVFVVLSAIGNWIQKREQERELERENTEGPQMPPPRRRLSPSPTSPASPLEEELRRLLQPQKPRPVVSAPAPAPLPPQLPSKRPYSEASPSLEDLDSPQVTLPPLSKAAQGQLDASQLSERVATRMRRASSTLGRLPASAQAMAEAERLDESAYRQILTGVAQSAQVAMANAPRSLSPDAAAAVAMLRQVPSTRQAVLLSVILGPPRGLDMDGKNSLA